MPRAWLPLHCGDLFHARMCNNISEIALQRAHAAGRNARFAAHRALFNRCSSEGCCVISGWRDNVAQGDVELHAAQLTIDGHTGWGKVLQGMTCK